MMKESEESDPAQSIEKSSENTFQSEISAATLAEIDKASKKLQKKNGIGDTAFLEARNLAEYIGVERLFLKFEGGNPTGTQKDRIALALVENAKTLNIDGIVAASCGNFGTALAYAAKRYDLPAHIFIPKAYHVSKDRINRLTELGAYLHYVDGHYEDAVTYSSTVSKEHNWYNANPHCNGVTSISLAAYGEIANEIFRDLRRAPNAVACPVGNGTTIAGVYAGFKELHSRGKTSWLPRMIATSTRRGNPIIKSFRQSSRTILDLAPDEIRETRVNEPLTNWHAYDGQEALDAIYDSNGYADYASDEKMIELAKIGESLRGPDSRLGIGIAVQQSIRQGFLL